MNPSEGVLNRAFERGFRRALGRIVQAKAEELFRTALTARSPLAQMLEEKNKQGCQRFLDDGIRWENNKPGFNK